MYSLNSLKYWYLSAIDPQPLSFNIFKKTILGGFFKILLQKQFDEFIRDSHIAAGARYD